MKNYIQFVLICGLLCSLACINNTEDVTGPLPDDEVIENVSYSASVQPIFNNACVSCHGSSGGVNLSSYAQLMNSVGNNYGSNLVVAGNADASGLVDKIEPDPQIGGRMPVGGSLTNTKIETIRVWIDEGAQNN